MNREEADKLIERGRQIQADIADRVKDAEIARSDFGLTTGEKHLIELAVAHSGGDAVQYVIKKHLQTVLQQAKARGMVQTQGDSKYIQGKIPTLLESAEFLDGRKWLLSPLGNMFPELIESLLDSRPFKDKGYQYVPDYEMAIAEVTGHKGAVRHVEVTLVPHRQVTKKQLETVEDVFIPVNSPATKRHVHVDEALKRRERVISREPEPGEALDLTRPSDRVLGQSREKVVHTALDGKRQVTFRPMKAGDDKKLRGTGHPELTRSLAQEVHRAIDAEVLRQVFSEATHKPQKLDPNPVLLKPVYDLRDIDSPFDLDAYVTNNRTEMLLELVKERAIRLERNLGWALKSPVRLMRVDVAQGSKGLVQLDTNLGTLLLEADAVVNCKPQSLVHQAREFLVRRSRGV